MSLPTGYSMILWHIFALKVIEIRGSLQQTLHTVTSLQALTTIENSVALMCICHPCHFWQYLFTKLKFSLDHTWKAMMGSDDTEHHISSVTELCHIGRKQFSWHMRAFIWQRLLRYLHTIRKWIQGSQTYLAFISISWNIKCMKISAVFCVCKSKSCPQAHHVWKVHC